ncbi:MAG: chorismate synthase [Chitinophagaceae bacterium]|nr:chorismate synthase [Chitinophagaceae bacterium]
MNTFGTIFRVSIFGESHGRWVGVTIDGCPPGIPLSPTDMLPDLERRKPGASGTTPRIEEDLPEFVSGAHNGVSTGAPLTIVFENKNTRSADYADFQNVPRPGHADFVIPKKFSGHNDPRGGGHTSGRLTVALVAAGVVAKKVLKDVEVSACLVEAGGNTDIDAAIAMAVEQQDSIGGIVSCTVTGLPIGLGEPFFNSVESVISHAVFSVPAIKGIEFGSGFGAARMTGSVHNDAIVDEKGTTASNNAGGINGGITNGNRMIFRVAVKPTSSTPRTQHTWNKATGAVEPFAVKGRHDLCIALRVPVVIEAVTAIALADLLLFPQHK